METQICQKCGGRGEIEEIDENSRVSSFPCPSCSSFGYRRGSFDLSFEVAQRKTEHRLQLCDPDLCIYCKEAASAAREVLSEADTP